mmetsp:Transcript_6519/g.18290  ORF Transcript_6519/g.18290 Transcript_6519/m.18290 type:complete len:119 (-) Transcript_6519:244-600(-)
MAWGPFVRVIMQVGMVAGGAIGRAVVQAYKEAAAGRAANSKVAAAVLRRNMALDEARQVLGVELTATPEEIATRFDLLNKLNAPSEESPGSPYLQIKISAAQTVLLEALAKEKAKNAE